jgi:hypothetical protein
LTGSGPFLTLRKTVMPVAQKAPPKMMLGFVVRQCAVALGHAPTPEEFAEWANNHGEGRGRYCLFGRPITVAEARVILRHPGRPVTVRSARPHTVYSLGQAGTD